MRAVFVLLALLGIVTGSMSLPERHRELTGNPREYRDRSDRMLELLGELRTPLAMLVFYQMDLYHELLDQEGVVANKQSELMPLLRLTTYLDPKVEEAYDLMAYDLLRGHRAAQEALAVLQEGLLYNPTSYSLNMRMGQFHLLRGHYAAALPFLNMARQHPRPDQGEIDVVNALAYQYHCYAGLHDLAGQKRCVGPMLSMPAGQGRGRVFMQEIEEGRSFHEVSLPKGMLLDKNY